jgi:hypothetical protein
MDVNKVIQLIKEAAKFPLHVRIAAELMRSRVNEEKMRLIVKELRDANISQVDLVKLENAFQDLLKCPQYFGLKNMPDDLKKIPKP